LPGTASMKLKLLLLAAAGAALAIGAVIALIDQQAPRGDGAVEIPIALDGSLQNAAWSPDGAQLVFTRFRKGYNKAPGDIFIVDLKTGASRALIDDGGNNVSQPGSTWNAPTGNIIFSSERGNEHDQIYVSPSTGGVDGLRQLTSGEKSMGYEPSFSPEGSSFAYEMHVVDEEQNGRIVLQKQGSSDFEAITRANEDCRQPNWSPKGDLIVYQKRENDQWDLWTYEISSKQHRKLTSGAGDKTDATFSPDGSFVVYSADSSDSPYANLYAIPASGGRHVQITTAGVYDGAPSWSPDGKSIVFETAPLRQPGTGIRGWFTRAWIWLSRRFGHEWPTRLATIKVPENLRQGD
jgi:TolB protein